MSNTQKQLAKLIALASLFPIGVIATLYAEAGLLPMAARAATPPEIPIRLSQAPPWRQTYACGNFAITLSEQGRDRYTYESTNAKGQTLTIKNGTHNAGRNYSSIYTFTQDGSDYVLEDYGGGKAELSIGSYPDKGMTYSCTTDGNP